MKILVTGANGFIGKNLQLRLAHSSNNEVLTFVRGQDDVALQEALITADAVIHLAGENRPICNSEYDKVNVGLTARLCQILQDIGKTMPVLFASSIQADIDNHYGRSKLLAEDILVKLNLSNGNPIAIFRLPGVFGKWCRPDYNSVVATFCHRKAHDLPISISDVNAKVRLVYVDDVITTFLQVLQNMSQGLLRPVISPEYSITLGELSNQIEMFKNCRSTLVSERVGTGLTRALYATYLSYLPVEKFSYKLPIHSDARGVFVEMLKTPDTGQFSYFTAHPGVTRGGHFHDTKNEKFLVIRGHARFGFRHMLTNEIRYIEVQGDRPQVVETVPGWTHDITNVGQDELAVILWANEIFDRTNPDTYVSQV